MKRLFIFFSILLLSLLFVGCEPKEREKFVVNFITNSESVVESQTVLKNSKLNKVASPTKPNCDFLGWTLEGSDEVIDLDTFVVIKPLTLYAKWKRQVISDLGGYNVKIAYLYNYEDTLNNFNLFKLIKEVEEEFNCKITIEPFPTGVYDNLDASKFIHDSYINNKVDYDFYIIGKNNNYKTLKDDLIPLNSLYKKYYDNNMNKGEIKASSWDDELYALTINNLNIGNFLTYNVGLLEKLKEIDETITDPGLLFTTGRWTYETFYRYLEKIKEAMEKLANKSNSKYVPISANRNELFLGLSSTDGNVFYYYNKDQDTFTNTLRIDTINYIKHLSSRNLFTPIEGIPSAINTPWMNGTALFSVGNLARINNGGASWDKQMWGEDTRFGYVPWPMRDKQTLETYEVSIGNQIQVCMAKGRSYNDVVNEDKLFNLITTLLKKGNSTTDLNSLYLEEYKNALSVKSSKNAFIKMLNIMDEGRTYFDPLVVGEKYTCTYKPDIYLKSLNQYFNDDTKTLNEIINENLKNYFN